MSQLHIHRIKMHNFKSFKGEHVISPLDPHFNVIVGSNGSGKSNIIDSILFVLGFKAKRMRQRINTDLIYSGEKRETMCYVEITFKKGQEMTTLMRQLKGGKNMYFLNGEEKSFQEISNFIVRENIDIENNRFAILQGEIEGISLMKPKNDGLLEYLEDIIGTVHYNQRIEQLENYIEKETDNFEVLATTYKFSEKEFNYVKDMKEKDEETLGLYLNKLRLRTEYNHILHSKLSKDTSVLTKECEDSKKLLDEMEIKNKDAKNEMAKYEESLSKHKTKVNKKEMGFKDLQKAFNKCDTKRMLIEDKKKKIQASIDETKGEIKNKEEKNRFSENEKVLLEKEINENNEEIRLMKENISKLKNEIIKTESKGLKSKYIKEISKTEKDLYKFTEEINTLNERILEYQNLIDRKNKILAKIQKFSSVKQIEKEFVCINKEIETEYTSLSEINNDIMETESELSKQNNKFNEIQKHDEASAKEILINKLFKNINGYVGRLGSLGTVDDDLVIAISAVAKNGLNNIVVNSTDTAEECIAILKRNNVERTTFIILDKIRECKLDGKYNYLMHHIQCKEEHKKAFFFVFSDTILCENLAEAKKIGMGKISRKVVTRDGKTIDKSGLMSGGGEYVKVTKMTGSKRNDFETNINKLKKALSVMVEGKKHILEKIASLKDKRSELEREREDLNIDSLNKDLSDVENKLRTNKNKEVSFKITENEKKRKELETKLEDLNKKLENTDDIETKRIKGEISILFENLTLFEGRNKNLSEKLNNIVLYDTKKLIKNLDALEKENKSLILPSDYEEIKSKLITDEIELKKLISISDTLSAKILDLKNQLGDDFNREIELKNTIDENKIKLIDIKKELENLKGINSELLIEFSKYKSYHNNTIVISYENLDDVDDISSLLESKKRELKKFEFIEGNTLNLKIFDEFNAKKKDFDNSKKMYEGVKDKMELNRRELEELIAKKHVDFLQGMTAINKNLKEIYQLLTFGGNAELEMIDPIDPFAEGITLSVMPPKKSWKNVSMLSGGEKTISSLALVFALHIYKPSPFYVMDEIDAALDYKNVSIISNYILEKTRDSQFLIVSLRNNMFELSDTLLGVYKNDGLSKAMMFDIREMKKKIMQ